MDSSKKASLVFRILAIGFSALGVAAVADGIASFGSHRLQLTSALLCTESFSWTALSSHYPRPVHRRMLAI